MGIKCKVLFGAAGMAVLLLVSCSTVGQYMPVSTDEMVLGTIQTTFVARDAWLSKNETINTHAYIKLLEAAVLKYQGDIDVRDIVWVTGKKIPPSDIEVSAAAKVIKVGSNEAKN